LRRIFWAAGGEKSTTQVLVEHYHDTVVLVEQDVYRTSWYSPCACPSPSPCQCRD
jgi:hypothetical protein